MLDIFESFKCNFFKKELVFFVICWSVFSKKRKSICLVLVCEVMENNMYLKFKSGKITDFSTKKSGETNVFCQGSGNFFQLLL